MSVLDDGDLDDSEDPDEPEAEDEDEDEDDSDETVACAYCGESVYEEAERCPSCGTYRSREDAPRRHSWWLLLGVLLGVAAVLGWVLRG